MRAFAKSRRSSSLSRRANSSSRPWEASFRCVRPSGHSLNRTRTQYGVELEGAGFAGCGNLLQSQDVGRKLDKFVGARGAVVELEGDVDQQNVETEKTRYRPSAHQRETPSRSRSSRRRWPASKSGSPSAPTSGGDGGGREIHSRLRARVHYYPSSEPTSEIDLVKAPLRPGSFPRQRPASENPSKPAAGLAPARGRLSSAEIAEIFRRFSEANPEPKGELEYSNPFTLLVAVVLSAQATDAGREQGHAGAVPGGR